MVQAQKQHHQVQHHQHVPAQQQPQQAVVAPGVQLANMPAAHLGPITSTQTNINWYNASPAAVEASPSHHVHMMHEQYPTPPSHHSQPGAGGGTPQHLGTTNYPPDIHYLTPSPDSPGQWSSSNSPHSAQSDWSEGISSPTQPVGNLTAANKTSAKLDNSVYI